MSKQMPRANNRKVPMRAALDIIVYEMAHSSTPDEHRGCTTYYFDDERSTRYQSNWKLKTSEGALVRQKRETIQYLTALRNQIDEVLAKLETAEPDENGQIHIWSSVYEE